jgi:hypothetical protein
LVVKDGGVIKGRCLDRHVQRSTLGVIVYYGMVSGLLCLYFLLEGRGESHTVMLWAVICFLTSPKYLLVGCSHLC